MCDANEVDYERLPSDFAYHSIPFGAGAPVLAMPETSGEIEVSMHGAESLEFSVTSREVASNIDVHESHDSGIYPVYREH